MSITKNKKISKNPEARYLVAAVLNKFLSQICMPGEPFHQHRQRVSAFAEYMLNVLKDAGISGIVWVEKKGVFRSDKSK